MSSRREQEQRGFRAHLEARPLLLRAYRIGVATVGALVLVAGILLIPYPGPGWLIIFAGLAILASEFAWARSVLRYVRGRYDAWTHWLGRQNLLVKTAVVALTCTVVLATLYLMNAFYLVAGWVGLGGWTWLRSPFLG